MRSVRRLEVGESWWQRPLRAAPSVVGAAQLRSIAMAAGRDDDGGGGDDAVAVAVACMVLGLGLLLRLPLLPLLPSTVALGCIGVYVVGLC